MQRVMNHALRSVRATRHETQTNVAAFSIDRSYNLKKFFVPALFALTLSSAAFADGPTLRETSLFIKQKVNEIRPDAFSNDEKQNSSLHDYAANVYFVGFDAPQCDDAAFLFKTSGGLTCRGEQDKSYSRVDIQNVKYVTYVYFPESNSSRIEIRFIDPINFGITAAVDDQCDYMSITTDALYLHSSYNGIMSQIGNALKYIHDMCPAKKELF